MATQIKLIHSEKSDIRRIRINNDITFEQLIALIVDLYHFPEPENITLFYVDEDGDAVTVGSDSDVSMSLDSVQPGKIRKLFVTLKPSASARESQYPITEQSLGANKSNVYIPRRSEDYPTPESARQHGLAETYLRSKFQTETTTSHVPCGQSTCPFGLSAPDFGQLFCQPQGFESILQVLPKVLGHLFTLGAAQSGNRRPCCFERGTHPFRPNQWPPVFQKTGDQKAPCSSPDLFFEGLIKFIQSQPQPQSQAPHPCGQGTGWPALKPLIEGFLKLFATPQESHPLQSSAGAQSSGAPPPCSCFPFFFSSGPSSSSAASPSTASSSTSSSAAASSSSAPSAAAPESDVQQMLSFVGAMLPPHLVEPFQRFAAGLQPESLEALGDLLRGMGISVAGTAGRRGSGCGCGAAAGGSETDQTQTVVNKGEMAETEREESADGEEKNLPEGTTTKDPHSESTEKKDTDHDTPSHGCPTTPGPFPLLNLMQHFLGQTGQTGQTGQSSCGTDTNHQRPCGTQLPPHFMQMASSVIQAMMSPGAQGQRPSAATVAGAARAAEAASSATQTGTGTGRTSEVTEDEEIAGELQQAIQESIADAHAHVDQASSSAEEKREQ